MYVFFIYFTNMWVLLIISVVLLFLFIMLPRRVCKSQSPPIIEFPLAPETLPAWHEKPLRTRIRTRPQYGGYSKIYVPPQKVVYPVHVLEALQTFEEPRRMQRRMPRPATSREPIQQTVFQFYRIGPNGPEFLTDEVPDHMIDRVINMLDNLPVQRPQIPAQRPRSDSQNVHDSSVTGAVRETLRRVQREVGVDAGYNAEIIQQVTEEIRQFAYNHDFGVNNFNRANFDKALNGIKNINQTVSSAGGVKEADALVAMWQYANAKPEPMKTNLRESLVSRIQDCVDRGSLCCATGRISRITDALSGIDINESQIRPIWAIKQEIIARGGRLNQEFQERQTPEVRAALDARDPTKDQEMIRDNYDIRLKHFLREELKKEYLDTKLISSSHFANATSWIEAL